MVRKRIWVYIRTFQCPDCGNKMVASKMKGAYGTGYKKELYCSLCKQEKTMEQIEIRQSNEMTKKCSG